MIAARQILKGARRSAPLAVGIVISLLALPSAARAGAPPAPLLPDLVQVAPDSNSIQVKPDSADHWLLEFNSTVGNVGAGALEVQGFRTDGSQDMDAYQMIYHQGSATPTQSERPIGTVTYDTDPSHNHWHFHPFDDYELRSLDGSRVYSDQKEGFCLVNFPPLPAGTLTVGPVGLESDYSIGEPGQPGYFCDQGDDTATWIREGISVGWSDEYTGIRSGTDVDLTGVPAGRYDLVQQVNTTHAIQELDYTNNAWSAVVDISYLHGPDQEPAAVVRTTCPGVDTCSYTDPSPPPPPVPPPPSSPPPPAAPDTTAPKLLLGGATRQRFLRGRAIYVFAKCNEVCTIKASGRIAALQVASSLRTASKKLTLHPGVRTKIKLPISARTRRIINRQLRRGARVVVRVALVASDSAGNHTGMRRRTLTLLRNRR